MIYNKREIKKMLKGALEICKEKGIASLEQWLIWEEELKTNE